MRLKLTVALLAFTLMISGCGYTQKAALPNDIQTIYVKTVTNRIPVAEIYAYHPGLEMSITKAIVRRLNKDGNLKVVSAPEKADAVLEGELIRFQQEGLRFTSLEQVQEFRLYIVMNLKLLNGQTGEMIWHEPNFSGDAEYFVSDVRSVGREEGTQRAVNRLAKNIVDRIVEDW